MSHGPVWPPPRPVPVGWHAPVAPALPAVPLAPTPSRHPQRGWGTVVAIAVLGVLALVALAVIAVEVGAALVPVAAGLALVPLVAVLGAVRWVDRWEPEPVPAIVVAFLWGASVSVLVALALNTGAMVLLLAAGQGEATASAAGAVVVAPVVEETVKGLGVLLIFLVWRRSFDGPVDGLVYAAVVAAGFAFVENFLYFGAALQEPGTGAIATVFVMRAVMSPFAHVLFTAAMGLALGYASQARSRGAWALALPVGWLVAVGLHALWNGSALLNQGEMFLVLYVLVQLPLFLGVLGLAVWVRAREGAMIRSQLVDYARAGWFTPQEVAMIGNLGERGRARRWAAGRGGRPGRRAMRDFQEVATRLAHARNRVLRGRVDRTTAADQHRLLQDLLAARAVLVRALTVGRAPV